MIQSNIGQPFSNYVRSSMKSQKSYQFKLIYVAFCYRIYSSFSKFKKNIKHDINWHNLTLCIKLYIFFNKFFFLNFSKEKIPKCYYHQILSLFKYSMKVKIIAFQNKTFVKKLRAFQSNDIEKFVFYLRTKTMKKIGSSKSKNVCLIPFRICSFSHKRKIRRKHVLTL